MPKTARQLAESSDDSSTTGEVADAPTSTGESTADLGSIASGLVSNMPEVQEHAVAEAEKLQQSAESSPTDKSGARFDSALHAVDSDGKPITTTRGTFALKRGRKAGGSAKPGMVASGSTMPATGVSKTDSDKAAKEVAARTAGAGAAEMLFMAGRVLGGEEWIPMLKPDMGLDERAMMHGAFGDYFVATGKTDIPPGVALSFAVCSYVGVRLAMPQTQSRFKTAKAKITAWWINRKLRKQGLTAEVKPAPASK